MNDEILKRMIRLEPGEFLMGSRLDPAELHRKYPGGSERWYANAPARRVAIERGFYLSRYETTVGEFRKFADASGYQTTAERNGGAYGSKTSVWDYVEGLSWREPGFAQTEDCPAACLSFDDALAYIDWLNAGQVGLRFRLPTDREWEYACRAGTETEFFWGDELASGRDYLDAADETGAPDGEAWPLRFPFRCGYVGTAPVGSFRSNPWGFYDMSGNVWEWVADEFPDDGRGKTRAVRGGSWRTPPQRCRSAFRNQDAPDVCFVSHGMRLAADSAS